MVTARWEATRFCSNCAGKIPTPPPVPSDRLHRLLRPPPREETARLLSTPLTARPSTGEIGQGEEDVDSNGVRKNLSLNDKGRNSRVG